MSMMSVFEASRAFGTGGESRILLYLTVLAARESGPLSEALGVMIRVHGSNVDKTMSV